MLASQRHEAAQTLDLSCLCCLEAVNLRRQEVQEARPFLCMTHTHSGLQITEIRKDFTGFIVIYNRRQLTGAIKLCQDWLNVFFRLSVCPQLWAFIWGRRKPVLCAVLQTMNQQLWTLVFVSLKLNFTDLADFIRRRVLNMNLYFFLVLISLSWFMGLLFSSCYITRYPVYVWLSLWLLFVSGLLFVKHCRKHWEPGSNPG